MTASGSFSSSSSLRLFFFLLVSLCMCCSSGTAFRLGITFRPNLFSSFRSAGLSIPSKSGMAAAVVGVGAAGAEAVDAGILESLGVEELGASVLRGGSSLFSAFRSQELSAFPSRECWNECCDT